MSASRARNYIWLTLLPYYLTIYQHNIFLFSNTQHFFWNPDMALQKRYSGKREVREGCAHCSCKSQSVGSPSRKRCDSTNHTSNFKTSTISRLIACKHLAERQQLAPCHRIPKDVNCIRGLQDLPVHSERKRYYCTNWCLPAYEFPSDSSKLEP